MKSKYRLISNKKKVLRGSLVTIFLLNILVINNASSEELYQGFNELGETAVNIIGESGTSINKVDWDGLAFNISKTNASSQCKSNNQAFPQKTIDGYTGYEFSPGVLFVIYSGTLSGYRGFSGSGVINYSYTFSSRGILSPSTNTESPWCADPRITNGLSWTVNLAEPWGQTTGSIRTGIYVSSSVNLNSSISVPSFYVNRGRPEQSAQGGPLIKGSGVTYTVTKPKLTCTVSAPPTIGFGQVPAKGDGWVPVASKDSTLQINCNSDSADATATAAISFTASPLYYNRSEMLEMTTDGSYGVGILNGHYGQGNISGCSSNNSNSADAVKFDGMVSKTLDLNVGTNEVPITWTVCRRGDIQRYGDVSAQATANINWD